MTKIEMSDEDKKGLIEAVQTAIGVSVNEFIMENNFITYNCIHMLKWDEINTSIAKNMNEDNYDIKKFNRGIFCPILIYDKDSKNIYLPMRTKNLLKLKKDRNKRKVPHYLDALVTKNKDIKVEKQQQEFFDTDKVFDKEMVEKILMPLNNIEINNFVVCVFDEIKGELIAFKALILDSNLREYYSEDWSHFISPTYNTTFDFDYTEPKLDSDDDLEIGIKDTNDLDINKKEKETKEFESC